jgi:hypothetical protein
LEKVLLAIKQLMILFLKKEDVCLFIGKEKEKEMKAGKADQKQVTELKARIRAAFTDLRRSNKVLARSRFGLDDTTAKEQIAKELADKGKEHYLGAAFYTVTDNRNMRDSGSVDIKFVVRHVKQLQEVQDIVRTYLTQRGLEMRRHNDDLRIHSMTEFEKRPRGRKPDPAKQEERAKKLAEREAKKAERAKLREAKKQERIAAKKAAQAATEPSMVAPAASESVSTETKTAVSA